MPINNAKIDDTAVIHYPELVNIYGCTIGAEVSVGPFVEIQKDVEIGPHCKIQSHSFICSGVTLGEGVFVGHGVMFVNDRYPQVFNSQGNLQQDGEWKMEKTYIGPRVSIGTNATIMCGVKIGEGSLVGAGSVVTHNVPPNCVVAGVPARIISTDCEGSRNLSRQLP